MTMQVLLAINLITKNMVLKLASPGLDRAHGINESEVREK
jgi:hypothetical protein